MKIRLRLRLLMRQLPFTRRWARGLLAHLMKQGIKRIVNNP
jgi:hypothetical protein